MSELEKKAIKQKSVLALAIALCKKGKSKTYAGAYALVEFSND